MRKLTAAIYLSAVLAVFGMSAWACGCAGCSDSCAGTPEGPGDDVITDAEYLEAPVVVTSIRFSDGKASWDAVTGKNVVYYIKVDDEIPTRALPLRYRNNMQIGQTITVIAVSKKVKDDAAGVTQEDADAHNTAMAAQVSEMWATAQGFTYTGDNQLLQPEVTIAGGVASWEAVEGATGYVYQIKPAGSDEWGEEQTTTELSVAVNVGDTIRVKATTGEGGMFPSEWCDEIVVPEASQLATPVVTIENGVARWANVQGRTSYEIKVNGEVVAGVETAYTRTFYALQPGDTIQVRALGDGTKADSEYSALQTYAVTLATPAVEINPITGEATWAALEGAVGYIVKVDGVDQAQQEETSYQLEDGSEIQVKAVGDGSAYLDGEFSVAQMYNSLPEVQLATPVLQLVETQVGGEYVGKISWQAVPNAGGYKYQVKAAGSNEWGEETAIAELETTIASGATIRVKALGRQTSTTLYLDGEWSEELHYEHDDSTVYLAAPVLTVNRQNGNVSWTAVENALGYVYQIQEPDSDEWGAEQTLDASTLFVNLTVDGQSIRVKTLGNETDTTAETHYVSSAYVTATYSQQIIAYLPMPSVFINNDGVASWAAVENASGYIVKVDGVDQAQQTETTYTLEDGQTIQVKAVGSTTEKYVYNDSGFSAVQTYVHVEGAENLAAPVVTLNERTGMATWDAIANASGYIVKVNGVDQEVQTATEYQLAQGDRIQVKAVGGEGAGVTYIDSDFSAEQTLDMYREIQVATPSVSVDENGMATWEAVENAVGYVCIVNGVAQPQQTDCSISIATTEIGVAQTLQVQAIGKGEDGKITYTNSELSAVETYVYNPDAERLGTPRLTLDRVTGKVTWTAVANATAYEYSIDGGAGVRVEASDVLELTLEGYEKVRVRALGDGGVLYLNGSWSNEITYTPYFDAAKISQTLGHYARIDSYIGERNDIPVVQVEYDGLWYEAFAWVTYEKDGETVHVDTVNRGRKFLASENAVYTIDYYIELTVDGHTGYYVVATTSVNLLDNKGPMFRIPASAKGMLVYKDVEITLPGAVPEDPSGVAGEPTISVTFGGTPQTVRKDGDVYKFTPTAFGDYTVTYSATDTKGNSTTASYTITCAKMVEICNFDTEDVASAYVAKKGTTEAITSKSELTTEWRYGDTGYSMSVELIGTDTMVKVKVYPKFYDLSGFDEIALSIYATEDMDTSAGWYLLNNNSAETPNSPRGLVAGENLVRIPIADFKKEYPNGQIITDTTETTGQGYKYGYSSEDFIWIQLRGPKGAKVYLDNMIGIFTGADNNINPILDLGNSQSIKKGHDYAGAYGDIIAYAGDPVTVPVNAYDESMSVATDYTVTKNGVDVTAAVKAGTQIAQMGETYAVTAWATDGDGRTSSATANIVVREKQIAHDMTGKETRILNYFNSVDKLSTSSGIVRIGQSVVFDGRTEFTANANGPVQFTMPLLLDRGDGAGATPLTKADLDTMEYVNIHLYSWDAGCEFSLPSSPSDTTAYLDNRQLCRLKGGWQDVTLSTDVLREAMNNGLYDAEGNLTLIGYLPYDYSLKIIFIEAQAVYAEGQAPGVQKTPLSTPAVTLGTGGTVTWTPVENAIGYMVEIDGNETQVGADVLEYTLEDRQTIRVKAIADANSETWQDGAYSTPQTCYINADLLNDCEDASTLSNGSLSKDWFVEGKGSVYTSTTTWAGISLGLWRNGSKLTSADFASYETVEFKLKIEGAPTSGVQLQLVNQSGTGGYMMYKANNEQMTVNGYPDGDVLTDGEYSIVLKPQVFVDVDMTPIQGGALWFAMSGDCTVYIDEVIGRYAPSVAVPNVTIDENGLATWNAVSGASGYEYQVTDANGNWGATQTILAGAALEVPLENGQRIRVKALSESADVEDSDYSQVQVYIAKETLGTPVVTIDEVSGIASWEAIENAHGYVVEINGVENDMQTATTYQLEDGDTIRVKAVVTVNVNYNNGAFSEAQTYDKPEMIKLATPTISLNYSNGMATWTAVDYAESYTVFVTDAEGDEDEIITSETSYQLEDGWKIQVKATSSNPFHEESDYSDQVTYEETSAVQLDKPVVTVTKATGVASWTADSNASAYLIIINGTEVGEQAETTYQLSDGDQIEVKAVGDGTNYMTSLASDAVTWHAAAVLATPVVTIDKYGVASWTAIDNAVGHVVKVNGTEQAEQTATEYQLADGQTIQVKAIAQANSEDYVDGDYCAVQTYTAVKLATPSSMTVDKYGRASWAAVVNAEKYAYEINGIAGETTATFVEGLTDGQTIRVKAIADTADRIYLDSDWSELVTFTAPPAIATPVVSIDKNGNATWTAVENAVGYVVMANGVAQAQQTETTYQLTDGQTIQVKAVTAATNTAVTDSAYSAVKTYVAPSATLETPTVTFANMTDATGTASWTAVTDATGYIVYLNGVAQAESTATSIQVPDGQTIQVQAVTTSSAYRDSSLSEIKTYRAPDVLNACDAVATWNGDTLVNPKPFIAYGTRDYGTSSEYSIDGTSIRLTTVAWSPVVLYLSDNGTAVSDISSYEYITMQIYNAHSEAVVFYFYQASGEYAILQPGQWNTYTITGDVLAAQVALGPNADGIYAIDGDGGMLFNTGTVGATLYIDQVIGVHKG